MELPPHTLSALIAAGIFVGTLQCFFGYRLFKFVLGVTGFFLGGIVGASLAGAQTSEALFLVLAAFVGGVVGAALLVVLYFVGVFLLGAWLGGLVGVILVTAMALPPVPLLLPVAAVLGGVLALVFQKFMIILSTALGGAGSVVLGIAYFTTDLINPANPEHFCRAKGSQFLALLLGWLVLGLAGLLVQYYAARKPKIPTRQLPVGEHVYDGHEP